MEKIAYLILVVAWFVIPSLGIAGELANTLLEYVLTDMDSFVKVYEVCLLMYEALRDYLQSRGK